MKSKQSHHVIQTPLLNSSRKDRSISFECQNMLIEIWTCKINMGNDEVYRLIDELEVAYFDCSPSYSSAKRKREKKKGERDEVSYPTFSLSKAAITKPPYSHPISEKFVRAGHRASSSPPHLDQDPDSALVP